jgi:aldoxime dehydratase
MDSAIASHLRCPRTLDRRVPEDFEPPYPCWTARAKTGVKQVVMGYFGVQSKGAEMQARACAALVAITRQFAGPDAPSHVDTAHYVDEVGYDNMIAIAYWTDPAAFERWKATPAVDAWWNAPERLAEGLGYFREIASPRMEHFETMFNTPDRLEGVGVAMGTISDDVIREHSYWGSARERIPLSQTDRMAPVGELAVVSGRPAPGQRVKVRGHENVAVIRSGEDWSDTEGSERTLYLDEMEPVLRQGMDFLRDHGRSIGCYFNRFMLHVGADGKSIEKTFGLSFWRSLADLERWAESHPTHVAIFGTFMRIVQELNFQLKLRVYHEVSVLKPDEQDYEYINCHPKTGILNGLPA